MANTYDRGDLVRLVGTFIGSGGVFVDPPSVFLLVKNPLGTVGTYGYGGPGSALVAGAATVIRAAGGAYYMDVVPSTLPAQGTWTYRFDAGGGAGAAAGEASFNIRLTGFL